ncbi:MAG: TraR/DksA family transcriptional regulator [bacterium]|nr:TraR/DksA family transcriptional regulator [bacterium]
MVSVEAHQKRLEERRRKIGRRVGRITDDLRRTPDPDSEERATEAENDEVLEGLDAAGRQEFDAIEAALLRIAAGTFGTCAQCGGAIDERRLEVIPHTPTCVDCAS